MQKVIQLGTVSDCGRSLMSDRNATIFFQKAYLSSLHDNNKLGKVAPNLYS